MEAALQCGREAFGGALLACTRGQVLLQKAFISGVWRWLEAWQTALLLCGAMSSCSLQKDSSQQPPFACLGLARARMLTFARQQWSHAKLALVSTRSQPEAFPCASARTAVFRGPKAAELLSDITLLTQAELQW